MVGVADAKLEVTSRCQAPLVPLYHVHLSAGCVVVKPTNGQGYERCLSRRNTALSCGWLFEDLLDPPPEIPLQHSRHQYPQVHLSSERPRILVACLFCSNSSTPHPSAAASIHLISSHRAQSQPLRIHPSTKVITRPSTQL
jgi:hypothetical protein